jgi:magnesium transporter
MITKYTYNNLTWIDVEHPRRDEIVHLVEEYNLPELVGEELLQSTVRSKVDFYEKLGLAYLVLHFPTVVRHTSKDSRAEQEIDFIIGKDFLITVHYEVIDPLHEFSKTFEVNSVLDKSQIGDHAGFLFFFIIRELYKDSLRQLASIDKYLEEVEDRIFNGNEESMVKTLSVINRRFLNFKQAIQFHEDILRSFESAGITLFGQNFKYYLTTIIGEYRKVKSTLESHREILKELQTTNDSLLTSKTNDIVKVLTIMSFVMLPLTLITGVFGMNTSGNLILIDSIKNFYIVIGAMTLTGLIMFVYFKGKKWF